MRVLIVSIGALEKGPRAPEMRPIVAVSYEGSSSTFCRRSARALISWYAVKFAAWFVA